MAKRDGFASSFGVLVAMAGSAVGLGNLWRFPYLVGTNGGAAFIIIYLAIVFVLAMPIMYSEFVIGRRAQSNVYGAFRKLAPGSGWGIIGAMAILCCILVVSFYSVVGGWTIDYLFKGLTLQFTSDSEALGSMFENTVTANWRPLLFMMLFVVSAGAILLSGVKDGIERYSKVLMPLLFVMVIVIAVRSVTLPGAGAGIDFLFKPNWSAVTANTFLDALGQAFFSLSVGFGIIFTYASYVKKDENLIRMSVQTATADTMFAILAGIAIMPAVFSFGISPGQGPGLVFVTLPYVFAQLPLGGVLAIIFFFVLYVAAITSAISLLEVVVAYVIEEFKIKRKTAVVATVALVAVLGVFCSLSQGALSGVKIFGNNIFDLFDKFSANILMPLGALLVVLFAGWKMKREDFTDEITSGGLHKVNPVYLKIIFFSVRYMAPVVIAVIMIRSLI